MVNEEYSCYCEAYFYFITLHSVTSARCLDASLVSFTTTARIIQRHPSKSENSATRTRYTYLA